MVIGSKRRGLVWVMHHVARSLRALVYAAMGLCLMGLLHCFFPGAESQVVVQLSKV
jgi:hypothetical protein